MIIAGVEPDLSVVTVITFIVNQGDALDGLGEETITGDQGFRDGGKLGGVVPVSRIDLMKQRNVKVPGDQQGQPDNPQVRALLLALAPLGEGRSRVEGVDGGEKIGCVVEKTGQIDLEAIDQRPGQVLFDGADLFGVEVAHVIPEPLARKLAGGHRKEPAKNGPSVPIGQGGLALGREAAVDGRQGDIGADADPLVPFPGVTVDRPDDIELLGQVIQSGRGGEVRQNDRLRFGRLGGSAHGPGDVLGLAEILLPDDFGFAVDSPALAGVPIGVAADDFFRHADRHTLGHTTNRSTCQDVVYTADYVHYIRVFVNRGIGKLAHKC